MNLKKSIFSYSIWIMFTVFCCMELIKCHLVIMDMFPNRQNYDIAVMVSEACCFLLAAAAFFLLFQKIWDSMRKRLPDQEKTGQILSVVLPVLLLISIIIYFAWYLMAHIPIMLQDDTYYQLAYADNGKLSFTAHGASWLYICLLHLLLLLFHNMPFAGVVLQLVLFFLALALLYCVMDLLGGTSAAVVSMAVLGFLPASLKNVFSLTPELFYTASYLLGLLLIAVSLKNFSQEVTVSKKNFVLFFLSGIMAGFLIYLDIFSVSLLFFAAAAFFMGDGREKRKSALYANLFAWGGMVCGFLLPSAACVLSGETAAAEYIAALEDVYFGQIGIQSWGLLPDISLVGSIFLLFLASFMIPSFLCWKKYQGSAFLLSLFLVTALSVFSVSVLDYQLMTSMIWSMLAGLGVYGIFRGQEEDINKGMNTCKIKDMDTDMNMSINTDLDMGLREETAQRGEASTEEEKASRKEAEHTLTQKPVPGAPLPNPLPVPKKLKKTKIDFDYPVEEKDMKFDIDVPDGDDFDI